MSISDRRTRFHHVAALDGIRAFAVLAVMASHYGFSWIPGGFYGVDAFFVLSGFLITSLLVTEWRGTGSIALGGFWARRARRLLPALFVLVAAIGVLAALWPASFDDPHLFTNGLATIFYSANWYYLAQHANYFNATTPPSPLLHTWSLAIEEQFYLVWPLVVFGILRLGRSRAPRRAPAAASRGVVASLSADEPEGPAGAAPVARPRTVPVHGRRNQGLVLNPAAGGGDAARRVERRRLEVLFAVSGFGALVSALWMAVVNASGTNVNRAYYGTDTRAQALLVGAALAAGFARWGPVRTSLGRRRAGMLAVAGAAATLLMWWLVPETSSLAFSGGFLIVSLATAGIITGAVQSPRSAVARLLARRPVAWLGMISYGVYLWYWPVLLVVTGARVHLTGYGLAIVRVALTIGIATASYYLVERPIRNGALPSWRGLVAAPAAAAGALCAVLIATLVPTGAALSANPPLSSLAPLGSSASSTGPPALPGLDPLTATHPLRVLVVGDSIAGSLAVGLAAEAPSYGVQLVNKGTPGCSVAMDQQIQVLWYSIAPGSPCKPGDPGALLAEWKSWVDAYNPDVVVYVARGELFNQEVAGQWTNITESSFDRYLTGRFREAVATLGARGAAVVLATSPYYDSGEQPSGAPWPEDNPARATTDDQIMRTVVTTTARTAGAGASSVSLFDLGTLVSPGGRYAQVVDGQTVRCSDGVHFSAAGGELVAPELFALARRVGAAHAAASPSGAWPGPLPPAVPGWWTKLDCPS